MSKQIFLETIIQYFETIPPTHRSVYLFGGLTIFLLLENFSPLFQFQVNKWKHLGINLFFTFTTILVNLFMAVLLLKTSFWVVDSGVGLLQWISMPFVLKLIVGLMVLDLVAAYSSHWVEHHVKWLWQFHIIHHSDMEIDASSGNRHHPGESVYRFIFTLLAIIISGAPFWLIMLYQVCSIIFAQFTHWNIQLPKKLNQIISLVLVTPNMHHVHHHYRQPYSDTNYGNIFSLWDRLFGTFQYVDNEKLIYGLDTYPEPNDVNNIMTLLKIPFQRYRAPIEYPEEEKL